MGHNIMVRPFCVLLQHWPESQAKMIKIISYANIALFSVYRKASINILWRFCWNRGLSQCVWLQISLIQMETCIVACCL